MENQMFELTYIMLYPNGQFNLEYFIKRQILKFNSCNILLKNDSQWKKYFDEIQSKNSIN